MIDKGRACFHAEAEALQATADRLDENFALVVSDLEEVIAAGRKIIFCGVGKSAHIGQKLTATFNSTGAPASFLDPTHALHGDLGLCTAGDRVILISNSGQSEELLKLVPMLKRFDLGVTLITGRADAPLARVCDRVLLFHVPREACPLQLAPTASTTVSMAMGDALAMVLMEKRGLTRDDFARFHPAGALGMTLLLRVGDIMRSGDRFPHLVEDRPVKDAILAMTKAKAGCLAVLRSPDGPLSGVFTDGDFRRSALGGRDFLDRPVRDFMSANPKVINQNALAVEALKSFEIHNIDDLIVVDDNGAPVGILDNQDLPKLKIV